MRTLPMIVLSGLTGLALLACAEGESVGDGGVTSEDALFGCVLPPCDGPPPPPLVDTGLPPPRMDRGLPPDRGVMDMGIPDECMPGSRIGPCALCNLDGVPEMPENDPSCPAIDCGGDEVYSRTIEGEEEVCTVTRRSPLETNCRGLGECYDDPVEFCGEPTEEEVARAITGPCLTMEGCEGDTPPDVQQAAPGAPCNGSGLCDVVGECTVSEDCAGFPLLGQSELCQSGEENGQPFCQFHVQPGGDTDCNTFCLQNNWRCARAWNDAARCVPEADEAGCGQDFESHICRCVPI